MGLAGAGGREVGDVVRKEEGEEELREPAGAEEELRRRGESRRERAGGEISSDGMMGDVGRHRERGESRRTKSTCEGEEES